MPTPILIIQLSDGSTDGDERRAEEIGEALTRSEDPYLFAVIPPGWEMWWAKNGDVPIIELPEGYTDADLKRAGEIASALARRERHYAVIRAGWHAYLISRMRPANPALPD